MKDRKCADISLDLVLIQLACSYLHILIQFHNFLDASKRKLLHTEILLKQCESALEENSQ